MTPKDPERLSSLPDDPELRKLLEAGREEIPNDAQLASVFAKLGPKLGPGGAGGAAGGRPAASGAGFGVVKGTLLGTLLLGGLWAGTHLIPTGTVHRAKLNDLAPLGNAELARVLAFDAGLDEDLVDVPAPVVSIPPALSVAPLPSASAPPALPPHPVLPPVQDSASELKLLQRAQDALLTSPDVALSLADEDVRRFPDGLLRQEAEVIAIQALAVTGRRAAAEARAAKFQLAYPRSTHLRRIDAILGRETPAP